jgi:hypothetical protein
MKQSNFYEKIQKKLIYNKEIDALFVWLISHGRKYYSMIVVREKHY